MGDIGEIRLDHVGVMVDDLDAVVEWYVAHLGMAVRDRWQDDQSGMRWAHLGVGNVAVEFIQRPGLEAPSHAGVGYHHLAVAVASAERAAAVLEAAGGIVMIAPSYFERHDMDWTFVQDPFGNIIELVSYRSSAGDSETSLNTE